MTNAAIYYLHSLHACLKTYRALTMLYLYQSNRLEDLTELLQAVRQRQPLNHPLIAEELVVQSQGMRRFLNQYLAKSSGIAANLRFSLPAALAWRLMREILPDTPALSPISTV